MTISEQVVAFREDLNIFDTSNEKLEYIMDLATDFKGMDSKYRNEENVVKGCSSLAWLRKECIDGRLILEADSNSAIAKGMLSLLLLIFSNRSVDEILEFDPKELNELEFSELFTQVRLQGLEIFLEIVYSSALECKKRENGS